MAVIGLLTLIALREGAMPEAAAPAAVVTVGATIFPLADIVQQVGGKRVQVVLVLPPGTSEHISELTAQRLRDLQRAPVLFSIGHGLDDRLAERIIAAVPGMRSVIVDRGIALRMFEEEAQEEKTDNEHGSGVDPHYWLTTTNAQLMATTVAETLAQLDPPYAAAYAANLTAYQAQLQELEAELQATVQQLPRREIVTMHDAWSYLAAQYGLRLVATYEPVEGRGPTLADLQRLRDTITTYGITAFFAEPQKVSSAATQIMQQEFGLRIFTLDPLGGGSERSSYIELMRFNMRSLAEGLSANRDVN